MNTERKIKSKISYFLEDELDRVNEYLSMAKANLVTATELCQNRCSNITPVLCKRDEQVINYLNKDLIKMDEKIDAVKDLIEKFKKFHYQIQE